MPPKKKAKAIPSTPNDGHKKFVPRISQKHIDLRKIMPGIPEEQYKALTGVGFDERSISPISNKTNCNEKSNKNSKIIKKSKNDRSSKKTKDTSSNNIISKHCKPSSMCTSSSKFAVSTSLSNKLFNKNTAPIKSAATTTSPTSSLPLPSPPPLPPTPPPLPPTPPPPPSLPLAIMNEMPIKKEEKYKNDKTICDSRLFVPLTKMISIPITNLNMLDERTTYKIRNNKENVTKKPLNEIEETINCNTSKRKKIINNNNSCIDTTTLSIREQTSVPENSLVSFHQNYENNTTKIDESTQIKNIPIPEIIEKKSSLKCPVYKIIEGTTFAVDGFRFGNISGVTDYFLTHFHADHYYGLQKSFSYPLWTSSITARLVRDFIKVDEQYIRVLDTDDKPVWVNGVEICALEANHCPGAVMFLFKLPDGRNILHTGDFRASADMEMYPCFWSCSIDILYLDTTYLKKSYDFMSQIDSIDIVKYEVNKFLRKNFGNKYLIIIGSYIIGKEKVWKAVSECTEQKVWLDEKQLKASKHIFSPDTDKHILDMIVERKEDAAIHVLDIRKVSNELLDKYLKDYQNHVMLAIKLSGCQIHSKNNYGNRISIIGIEYSEHSSYSELERFVRFLKPKKVISTVPLAGNNLHICPNVPDEWISYIDLKPMAKSYQRDISSYFKKIKPVP